MLLSSGRVDICNKRQQQTAAIDSTSLVSTLSGVVWIVWILPLALHDFVAAVFEGEVPGQQSSDRPPQAEHSLGHHVLGGLSSGGGGGGNGGGSDGGGDGR